MGVRARPVSRLRRLTALAALLPLLVQLFAVPYHQALAASATPPGEPGGIASELKAVFGDAASLCVQADDRGAPSPPSPAEHCDDQCPLCRFAAEAAALVPPVAPAVPECVLAGRQTIGPPCDLSAAPAPPPQPNRARAPPLAV